MRVAVVLDHDEGCQTMELADDGARMGPAIVHEHLPEAVAAYERTGDVRWVWPVTSEIYPVLLRAGVPVRRCHDVTLVEALLLSRQPPSVDAGPPPRSWGRRQASQGPQAALFEPRESTFPSPAAELEALAGLHASQLERITAGEHPGRFGLLAASESAGGLAAAEMTCHGLPWQAAVHAEILTELLGPRPAPGMRPAKLASLASQISGALGGRPVNPDSPAQVRRALAAEGVIISSTRSHVLKEIGHPAAALLLEYKELARLYTANGWAWLGEWVSQGRFRPEYVVGGVVSGRWASRGGGALQIPRVLRRAIVADPGWVLVVADAAQLEPRILAALSRDTQLAAAAGGGDLYTALATVFGGDRAKAKVALLSAMYGGTGGETGQLLAVFRSRYPVAAAYVEAAARTGEEGGVVSSRLGRTCPPPSQAWRGLTAVSGDDGDGERQAGRVLRARGRFTRNFVVQASAADWAAVLLALLRQRLADMTAPPDGGGDAQLVFFQHDEVLVHCPEELAGQVVTAVGEAAAQAGRLVFGDVPVKFPVTTAVVTCYADAK